MADETAQKHYVRVPEGLDYEELKELGRQLFDRLQEDRQKARDAASDD